MTNTTQVSIPEKCKRVVTTEEGGVVLRERPTQVPGENEILVKVAAIGINPSDWRTPRIRKQDGNYAGCDFVGEVVKIGPNPKVGLKIGDRVSASVFGGRSTERGAFSEYATTFTDIVWNIPEGTFSYEEAVTTGVPLNTAFQVLYGPRTLRLIQPGAATPPEGDTWIFVYGGSSSVGQYLVQLAKLSGYKVATVASPRNHKLLETLGADLILDYHDTQFIEKLKKETGDKIYIAADAISEANTQAACVRVLSESKPGKVIVVLFESEEARNIRKDVEVIATFVPTAYGLDTFSWKAHDGEREALAAFLQNTLPGLVKAGKIRPNAVKLWDGGLEKVGEGIAYLHSGKASAEKVVFRL